jgi:hypothetical protein
MAESDKLRKLADWHRESAERAGNPWTWEARLKRAAELEREAAQLKERLTRIGEPPGLSKPKLQTTAGRWSQNGGRGASSRERLTIGWRSMRPPSYPRRGLTVPAAQLCAVTGLVQCV